jgi:molybdate transport system ATP-binding protein
MSMPTPEPQSGAAPLIRLEQTSVRIAGMPVLEPIDWALYPGEHWGVVGANGSGKSTFLGLVAGTVWPAPGTGRRLYDFGTGSQTDAVEARQRVSIVGHELQNLYARRGWNFRASDIVRSGITRTEIPRRHASASDQRAVAAILEQLGIGQLAGRRFFELSRGEQRRVLIARAMAFRPAILLLDEPTSGLDAASRSALEQTLGALAATTTLICTAHDASELAPIFRHIVELDAGRARIRSTGPAHRPQQIAPDDRRTAAEPDALPRREIPAGGGAPVGDAIPATPLIEIDNASVFIGERAILRNVDWRLEPGENWLVTGPNGAGKSTFLRLLHGQIRPATGGSIRWPAFGNPRSIWTLRRRIGYVSAELQAAYRYPSTVGDCIASGFESSIGLTRRLSDPERIRVDELIDAFDLGAYRRRSLTTLSYGQMHRVLLARTLANAPQLLLLDEPWEGLDRATRDLVLERIAEFAADGGQLVCVSHVAEPGLEFSHRLSIAGGLIRRDDAGA